MRILELPEGASPRAWGRQHGEMFRAEIHALSAIRTYLCTKLGAFPDRASVLRAAHAHLPVLERYDDALFEELLGIAEGAALTPAEIVVTNHYTDLRDLDPEPARWAPAPAGGRGDRPASVADDGCSVVWAATPTGRIMAQTWDMHATAIPYVMMLHVPASEAGPAAWCLTLTGCLGLAGINAARVAITINNLSSKDATVGAVWPAVVRRALHARTAGAARDLVLAAPIGSGHHYLVGDRDDAYAIETSGVLRKVMFTSRSAAPAGPGDGAEAAAAPASYCHTNHCLDPDVAAVSTITATSTTRERMAWLEASLAAAPVRDLEDVWMRLGSTEGWPRSVCTNTATPENPHGTATCGAIAMNLDSGEVWAQTGFITHVRPVELSI